MDKKDIILFGLGVLVGYAVIKATSKNVVASASTPTLPDTSSQTQPPVTAGAGMGTTQIQEPEVIEPTEDPKIKACKEKWIKFAETKRFSSAEQEQGVYDNFMTSCVAQS